MKCPYLSISSIECLFVTIFFLLDFERVDEQVLVLQLCVFSLAFGAVKCFILQKTSNVSGKNWMYLLFKNIK